jgi:hypothetical protein
MISSNSEKSRTNARLDRVFSFEHIIQRGVASPVPGASTDVGIDNRATELVQQVSMNWTKSASSKSQPRVGRVVWKDDTDILESAVL